MMKLNHLYLIFVLFLILGCEHKSIVNTSENGVDFCIPIENYRDLNISWIPDDVPSGGFLFKLDKPLFSKSNYEITGHVVRTGYYLDYKKIPPLGSQWRKVLFESSGRRIVAGGRFIAAKSLDNYSYLVWSSGSFPVNINDVYSERSEVIANCSVKKDVKSGKDCDRVISFGNVAIKYTFDYDLLDQVELLDKYVIENVELWKCKKENNRDKK